MRGAIKCSQVGVFNLKMWSCNRLFQGDLFFCCLCFFCSGGGAGRRRRSGEELGAQYGGRYSWASGRDSGGRGGGGSDWPFGAFLELAWLIMADIHLPPKNKYGMRSTIILCWLTYNKEIYICRISHRTTEKEGTSHLNLNEWKGVSFSVYERTRQGNLLCLPRPPVAFVSPEALANTTRTLNICSSSDAIDMVWREFWRSYCVVWYLPFIVECITMA